MKIALDIDDTITKHPKFFAELSKRFETIIVTSRPNTKASIDNTIEELNRLAIKYASIHFCDWNSLPSDSYPEELEGAEILLYQKVVVCEKQDVEVLFDDDVIVHRLINKYLPSVSVLLP